MRTLRYLPAALLLLANSVAALDTEWSGNAGLEARYFFEDALDPRQFEGGNLSVSVELQYHASWDGGNQQFNFTPFLRLDQHDSKRTHADVRELEWILARADWELRVGARKVFWGVTEAEHLVDIINQTDLVENPDGEDKLGQPMINFALIRDWGTVDVFFMPWFRERTFPGDEGRLRPALPVDFDQTRYASGAGRHEPDWAIRWSHVIGDWDIGLSHFSGTSRQPVFEIGVNDHGQSVLVPVYHHIDQTGLDLQLTADDTLWKLEVIRRVGHGDDFFAAAGGFEHTLYAMFDSAADIGLLAEYLYNSDPSSQAAMFEDDLFLGVRLTLNDVQDTQLLVGVIQDLDGDGRLFNLEASRRLGDDWRLTVEARLFNSIKPLSPQWDWRRDDYIQLELAKFF